MKAISEAENFIKETQKGFQNESLLEWGVFEKEFGVLIGTCAYADWNKEHKRAEIGFALRRDKWGKGFMNELLSEFIPFGFNEIDLNRIEADVDPRNKAAIKLLEKFNFKKEGYLRERYHQDGEIQDTVFYGLLKREYNFG
jgi:ribosomal-protein-alanine N-acetyltransferase